MLPARRTGRGSAHARGFDAGVSFCKRRAPPIGCSYGHHATRTPPQDVRTAILINCGAAEDVRSLLGLLDRPNVRVVIVDSHRPICHLNNVDSPEDCVAVLLDESEGTAKADIPPAGV